MVGGGNPVNIAAKGWCPGFGRARHSVRAVFRTGEASDESGDC
jgi:hypothetical protein